MNESKQKKRGGLKQAFQDFITKLGEYLEVVMIYVQKNLQVYVKQLVLSSVWLFSALFLLFLAFIYLSIGFFLTLQKYLVSGDPIFASFGTAFLFFLLAVFFVELVLKKK